MDINKLKIRCKEGQHYSDWLYVPDLIQEVEKAEQKTISIKELIKTIQSVLHHAPQCECTICKSLIQML